MKAFITGITGFAGPYLAEHLLASGDEVCGGSAAGEWPRDVPEMIRQNVPLISWDLAAGLDGTARRQIADFAPDVIYHLAAISIPEDCGRDVPTPEAIAINVDGTRGVAELAESLPKRPRILFTSTGHVYAPITFAQPWVNEVSLVAPTSGYGKSKLAAEEVIRRFVDALGGDAVIARVFKHAGARQTPRLMLPQWAEQLVRDTHEAVRVYSLDSFLDLSDVRDVSRAYRLLVEKGKSGETYNIGSGINRRSGDVFAEMQRLAGSSRSVVETRPGRRQEPIADITKITSDTGWRPTISLEQTVRDVYEDWRRKASRG